ncbi:MAG: transcriptional regulator, MarR family [Thermoleophilia bacterium]|nr:transcriptional regulator, MarR family [Thermoleophilia bacterium]
MTAAPEKKPQWSEVVALMRRDVRELGRDSQHAPRFLQRCTSTTESLTAQLRRGWGVNAHEMQAISTLWEFGRMTMTELGRRIPLSRAAVTTLTDRLERLGYVKRVPDPTDRRRILLEVTERVEQEFARINGHWNHRVEEYVRALEPDAWNTVVGVLADLREMARQEAAELRELSREELEQLGGGPRRAGTRRDPDGPPSWW